MSHIYNTQTDGALWNASKLEELLKLFKIIDVGLYNALSASYVIMKIGSLYYAFDKDGLAFQGEGTTVFQSAISACPTTGAKIFLQDPINITGVTIDRDMVLEGCQGGYDEPNIINDSESNDVLTITGYQVVLRNVFIDGQNKGGHAIKCTGGSYLGLDNVWVKRAGKRGIYVEGVNPIVWGTICVIHDCKEEGFYLKGTSLGAEIKMLFLKVVGCGNGVSPRVPCVYFEKVYFVHIGTLAGAGGTVGYGGRSYRGIYFYDEVKFVHIGLLHVEALDDSGLIMCYTTSGSNRVSNISIGNFYALDTAKDGGYPLFVNNADNVFIGTFMDETTGASYSIEASSATVNQFVIANCLNAKAINGYSKLTILNKKFQATVLSPTFAIDASGVKTVTIPHGLSVTPEIQDCQLTIVKNTDVTDWTAGWIEVYSVDGTNVVAKVNVTLGSATGGATAKLALRVGKP